MVPPDGWSPTYSPWKSDQVKVICKLQVLSLLCGENRQEKALQTRRKRKQFLQGSPLETSLVPRLRIGEDLVDFKVRKLQVLLDCFGVDWRGLAGCELISPEVLRILRLCIPTCVSRKCEVGADVVTQVVDLLGAWGDDGLDMKKCMSANISMVKQAEPPRDRTKTFWTYVPREKRYYHTRIVSAVKPRKNGGNPVVETQLRCSETGASFHSQMDEEDVEMYLANGFSKEPAFDCTNCVLCEVCLVSCGLSVEPSDTNGVKVESASLDQLERIQLTRPAVVCSDCSLVVHADCTGAMSFSEKALVHYIARTKSDWFCTACCEEDDESLLKFGYDFTPPITRREYDRRGLEAKPGLSVSELETMFWDLIDSSAKKVSVLYASDLDSREVAGGAFPAGYESAPNPKLNWDLRHLAVSGESLLKSLPQASQIAGVSRPWMYLGSRFSAFCWHTEDHFLTSVSYLHSGCPKVWYTLAPTHRERMDEAIRKLLPDLVAVNRDLQHQLVTMINPETLATLFNLPITRVIQNPGEFIITFPQAYHCGFNTGPNLAEAVNVATSDWLHHAIRSIQVYRAVKRIPVICIEKLLWECAMAVVEKQECRKEVGEDCLAGLTWVATQIEQPPKGVSKFVHGDPDCIPSCSVCANLCYFAFATDREGTISCAVCAHEKSGKQSMYSMRHKVEYIRSVAESIRIQIRQYRDIRRSSRVPGGVAKQPRLD